MTGYMNKMFSLEEKALAQVAINLCQENGFKEIALNLENPTYGGFIYNELCYLPTFFVSDPETLSKWAKVGKNKRLRKAFQNSRENVPKERLMRWHAAVDAQCERLTDGIPLPQQLKQKIHPWINRIALEYLTYSRRQEVFFDISRYFFMNNLTVGDWQGNGQVDEEKVARRMLKDDRLTVLQRYLIACIYCLEEHVLQFWSKLTQEEKQFFIEAVDTDVYGDRHHLVSLWSRFMNGDLEERGLWPGAIWEAIHCGNHSAVVVCWKRLNEPVQQQMVIYWAGQCIDHRLRWEENCHWKETLVSPLVPGSPKYIEHSTLPSFYNKLLIFFLSQMEQEQQLEFFTLAFELYDGESVTEFLLEWPYQDYFLPTINRLWGIMPKEEYRRCVRALVKKYAKHEGNANCIYDYRGLFGALWEETPEEYKNYVSSNSSFI